MGRNRNLRRQLPLYETAQVKRARCEESNLNRLIGAMPPWRTRSPLQRVLSWLLVLVDCHDGWLIVSTDPYPNPDAPYELSAAVAAWALELARDPRAEDDRDTVVSWLVRAAGSNAPVLRRAREMNEIHKLPPPGGSLIPYGAEKLLDGAEGSDLAQEEPPQFESGYGDARCALCDVPFRGPCKDDA